jgi:hypothetical protein
LSAARAAGGREVQICSSVTESNGNRTRGIKHGPSEMERRYCELLVRQEEGKGKGVLVVLNGMVTVLGELNMDRL